VGAPNPVTGKPAIGSGYAPATVVHGETVLRGFYDFHRDAGTGPILNPFPLDASRRSRRAHAHHNPMDEWKHERMGRYRPSAPRRIPRAIPDDRFNELFAALSSNRDRALVAFWISTGTRASELLGARHCDVDPGQQLITVVRKGSRTAQQVPASADAFVWLRLYQEDLHGKVPRGRTQPLVDPAPAPPTADLITPPTACSNGPTPCWELIGPCTPCDIPRRRGWPATRS
jgi:integrase